MKLKRVYQQGGGLIYTPFIPGRTESSFSGGSSGSGNGEDEPKIDPLDKEIIALMKDQNLLPSDIQIIFKSLNNFQRKTQHLSKLGGTEAYRSVMPNMLKIIQMVSVAKNNKQMFDDSVKTMTEREAGGEVALDTYGRMWVQDKENGSITRINPSDFNENYIPLSNSQVLDLRRSNPELAFDTNSFETVGNNIVGMKQIQQEIAAVIKDFGTRKSDSFEARAFADLAKEVAEKGYFKVTTEQTRSLDDLEGFTKLLWNTLGNNARNLLNARAAISGTDAISYLADMIFKDADVSVSSSFDASMTKAGGGAGSSGSDGSLVKTTYAEHLVWGDLDPARRVLLQPGNSDIAMYVYAQNAGPIKKDGTVFESSNFNEIFTKADALGTIVDRSNIIFGDQIVSSNDFARIMYDNGENMERVELPTVPDEQNPGKFKIDYRTQQEVDKIKDYLHRMGGMVPDDLIEEQLEDFPNAYWDREHKVIRFRNSRPFLVVKAIASSEKVHFNIDSPYIQHIEKDENNSRKDYMEMYNNAINYGYAYPIGDKKKKPYDSGESAGRHLYSANLYMPISGEVVATALHNSERLPASHYMAGTPTNMAQLNQESRQIKTNF